MQLVIKATRWMCSGTRRVGGKTIAERVDAPGQVQTVLNWKSSTTDRQIPSLGDGSITAAWRELNDEIQKPCPLESGPKQVLTVTQLSLSIRGFAVVDLRYHCRGKPYEVLLTQEGGFFATESPFGSREAVGSALGAAANRGERLENRLLLGMACLGVLFFVPAMLTAGLWPAVLATVAGVIVLLVCAELLHSAVLPALLRNELPGARAALRALMLRKGDREALVAEVAGRLKSEPAVLAALNDEKADPIKVPSADVPVTANLAPVAGMVALCSLVAAAVSLIFYSYRPLWIVFGVLATLGQFACLLLVPQLAGGDKIRVGHSLLQALKVVLSVAGVLIGCALFEWIVVGILRYLLALIVEQAASTVFTGVLGGAVEGFALGAVLAYFSGEENEDWTFSYGAMTAVAFAWGRAASAGNPSGAPLGDALEALLMGMAPIVFLVLKLWRDGQSLSDKLPRSVSRLGMPTFAITALVLLTAGVLHTLWR